MNCRSSAFSHLPISLSVKGFCYGLKELFGPHGVEYCFFLFFPQVVDINAYTASGIKPCHASANSKISIEVVFTIYSPPTAITMHFLVKINGISGLLISFTQFFISRSIVLVISSSFSAISAILLKGEPSLLLLFAFFKKFVEVCKSAKMLQRWTC